MKYQKHSIVLERNKHTDFHVLLCLSLLADLQGLAIEQVRQTAFHQGQSSLLPPNPTFSRNSYAHSQEKGKLSHRGKLDSVNQDRSWRLNPKWPPFMCLAMNHLHPDGHDSNPPELSDWWTPEDFPLAHLHCLKIYP